MWMGVLLIHLLCAGLAYVWASAQGMQVKYWCCFALLFGFCALILLQTHSRLNRQRQIGRDSQLLVC